MLGGSIYEPLKLGQSSLEATSDPSREKGTKFNQVTLLKAI